MTDIEAIRAKAYAPDTVDSEIVTDILTLLTEHDRLTRALAESPHSSLCSYMVDHFHEPCSCWKADPSPLFAVTGATTITYGDVRRLTIAGPHGPVLALPRVGSARVELDGDRLTVHYENPEATT